MKGFIEVTKVKYWCATFYERQEKIEDILLDVNSIRYICDKYEGVKVSISEEVPNIFYISGTYGEIQSKIRKEIPNHSFIEVTEMSYFGREHSASNKMFLNTKTIQRIDTKNNRTIIHFTKDRKYIVYIKETPDEIKKKLEE